MSINSTVAKPTHGKPELIKPELSKLSFGMPRRNIVHSKLPASSYRGKAAVIGSGFGGLAAAIRLQAMGFETICYEGRDAQVVELTFITMLVTHLTQGRR